MPLIISYDYYFCKTDKKKNQSSDWQYFFSVFPWPFFSTWCLWIKIVLFNWLLLFKHYNLITVFLKFSCIYLYNDRWGRKWFDSLHCVLKNLEILGLPFEESYLKFESSPCQCFLCSESELYSVVLILILNIFQTLCSNHKRPKTIIWLMTKQGKYAAWSCTTSHFTNK